MSADSGVGRRAWLGLAPVGLSLLSLGVALLISAIAILLLGSSPILAARALAEGSFGSLAALGETSLKATALTFTGLAVALPLAAGFFNIGGQGQFLCGAIAAAWGRFTPLSTPSLSVTRAAATLTGMLTERVRRKA